MDCFRLKVKGIFIYGKPEKIQRRIKEVARIRSKIRKKRTPEIGGGKIDRQKKRKSGVRGGKNWDRK